MSIVVNGAAQEVGLVVKYLHNYKHMCSTNGMELLDVSASPSLLSLSTKYYTASLTVHAVELGALPHHDVVAESEGYILVLSGEDDLSHERYELSRRMIEADAGLRLLINLAAAAEDEVSPISQRFQEWALDNGFEYIEIDTANLTASHGDREKYGLPRLMEALESNMWSTMQRHTVSTAGSHAAPPVVSAHPTESAALDTTTLSNNSNADVAPATAAQSVEPAISESAPVPVVAPEASSAGVNSQSVGSGAQDSSTPTDVDPFEELMEDKEDNEIIDKFASFITEAQNFRQQAVSGDISDEARRERAANMALRLSQLMALDEGSDSD